jgi:pyridoxine 5-phosphate synthase
MRFYVNIDHVATVRQARGGTEPDPVDAAMASERAGADGITAHLREDRRHVQDDDMRRLASQVSTVLNFELAATDEILSVAEELRPFQATLVPERREEITTEGGLALGTAGDATDMRLRAAIDRLQASGIRVSLFIDPDAASVARSAELGVPAIELHTGRYANTYPHVDQTLGELQTAARDGAAAGLAVHAGHGLDYENVQPVAAIPEIEELNIGHSIVSRSILVGMESAVREMRGLIDAAR